MHLHMCIVCIQTNTHIPTLHPVLHRRDALCVNPFLVLGILNRSLFMRWMGVALFLMDSGVSGAFAIFIFYVDER